VEELEEAQPALLPYHQRRDISERRENTACVGRDHDDDAAKHDELIIADADGHHHGAHHERGGQIVDDRAENERQPADQPEKLPIREAQADELCSKRVEDAPLLHRVHVRDGHDQEQHQLAVVLDHMLCGGLERRALAIHGIGNAEQRPDEARGQHDRLRFAQLNGLLDDHEPVGDEEDQERQVADRVPRQVDALGGVQRVSWCGEKGEKSESGQGPRCSGRALHSIPPVL
jgi:hypothetical protein